MSPDPEKSIAPLPQEPSSKLNSLRLARDRGASSSLTLSIDSAHGATISQEKDVELGVLKKVQDSPKPQPVKVPRHKRHGLFRQFTILAEVEEPKDYPNKTKWFITFVVAMAAVAAPLGSTIIFPALPRITAEFHTTGKITNLSVALYMLGMSIFPLWWSSFSETLGRRTVYLVSFMLFLLFSILGAVSTSISMFVVVRMLGGGASASVQAVGAGTIADVWEVRERGRAMGIFYLGPLLAPLLGPIVGGLLTEGQGWRSTQWFLAVYGVILVLFLFFALPETHKSIKPILQEEEQRRQEVLPADQNPHDLNRMVSRRSVQQTAGKWVKITKRIFIDPLKILLYLRFPAVLLSIYYASITFGSLYLLNISMEVNFSQAPYNFSTIDVGLAYIPSSLGYLLSSMFGGKWTDTIMAREARKAGRYDEYGKPVYIPEDRMRENAWMAAVVYPIALIWYGWTAEKGLFWAVPLTANLFFGLASMIIFGTVTTMLTEFMPHNASAGVAANNFVRNIFSCVGAVAAEPVIAAVGSGWLFTVVGVVALGSGGGVVWALRKYGPQWRVVLEGKVR